MSERSVQASRIELFANFFSSTLVFLIGSTFLILSTTSLIRGSSSRNWGAVMGTLSSIERQADNRIIGACYSYRVGGKTFKGDRVCFGFVKARATSVLLGKRPGERLLIYVNPKSPDQSVLITGPDPGMKIMCALSAAATIAGATVSWVFLRKLRKR